MTRDPRNLTREGARRKYWEQALRLIGEKRRGSWASCARRFERKQHSNSGIRDARSKIS